MKLPPPRNPSVLPVRFPAQADKSVESSCRLWLESPPRSRRSGAPAIEAPTPDGIGTCEVNDDRRRITVRYSGQVQGVGFRYSACSTAAGFDVCGSVRNLGDGSVELVAEGARAELEAFRQAVRDSGLGPLIRDESVEWSAPQGNLRGFQILR